MTVGERQTLAEVKRQAAVDLVLTSARRFVIQCGLDATMDQLAEVTGVSRRTLFRLFGTRERLIADAFTVGMLNYFHGLPEYNGDLHDWLRSTCDAVHRMSAGYGPGFWELTFRSDLPPDLAQLEKKRRRDFRKLADALASQLWLAAGQSSAVPDELLMTVGAHLSPHFTAAVHTELARDWHSASNLAYQAIDAALERLTTIEASARP
jgi:AcrR family transcriptional regulator